MNRLGKYEVLDELGQGGMGVVYRARDPVIGRLVAIKVILDRAMDAPAVRERFAREARSAGALSHENIMTIYDVGEEDGRPYIVMELLDGHDLRHVLGERPLPSLDARIDVALQVCAGLGYAHSRGVIHRDIKPENVRVTSSGRVKILDFGIARIETEAHTVTQAQIGTPRYMSPEQIKGGPVDQRTDIFSFGVLLYEMFAGVNPFAGEHVTTVIYKVLHEEPPPPPLPGVPASRELQRVVARCLAKAPAKRFGTLAEVADALRHARAVGVDAPPDATGPLTGLFSWFRRDTPSAPLDTRSVNTGAGRPSPEPDRTAAVPPPLSARPDATVAAPPSARLGAPTPESPDVTLADEAAPSESGLETVALTPAGADATVFLGPPAYERPPDEREVEHETAVDVERSAQDAPSVAVGETAATASPDPAAGIALEPSRSDTLDRDGEEEAPVEPLVLAPYDALPAEPAVLAQRDGAAAGPDEAPLDVETEVPPGERAEAPSAEPATSAATEPGEAPDAGAGFEVEPEAEPAAEREEEADPKGVLEPWVDGPDAPLDGPPEPAETRAPSADEEPAAPLDDTGALLPLAVAAASLPDEPDPDVAPTPTAIGPSDASEMTDEAGPPSLVEPGADEPSAAVPDPDVSVERLEVEALPPAMLAEPPPDAFSGDTPLPEDTSPADVLPPALPEPPSDAATLVGLPPLSSPDPAPDLAETAPLTPPRVGRPQRKERAGRPAYPSGAPSVEEPAGEPVRPPRAPRVAEEPDGRAPASGARPAVPWHRNGRVLGGAAVAGLVAVGALYVALRGPATPAQAEPEAQRPVVVASPLDSLAAQARAEVARMTTQRDSARQAAATDTDDFRRATELEREAQAALAAGDEGGLRRAVQLAGEAAGLFVAARHATTGSVAELREAAVRAERTAAQARQPALAARQNAEGRPLFARAEEALAEARSAQEAARYADAVRLYGDAERGYQAARAALDRTAEAADAERDRLAVDAARAQAQRAGARGTFFSRAEDLRASGNRALRQRNYLAARTDFRRAVQLYTQATAIAGEAPEPEPEAPTVPSDVLEAQRRVVAARQAVPSAGTGTDPYRRAERARSSGDAAVSRRNYATAREQYASALTAYQQAASYRAPEPEREPPADAGAASAAVQRLAAQFARALEAEDVGALRSLDPAFGRFGSVFDIADDVRADVTTGAPSVRGSEATADVTLALRFMNAEGRPDEQVWRYVWTLRRSGSDWQLAGVRNR